MNADARQIHATLHRRPIDWSERIAKGLLTLALVAGVLWALAQGGLSSPIDLTQLLG
jgi:hypothetical protein